jgi:uncharacterized protein with NRDE domain
MCTASWIFEEGGYQLFFNRDEQRTRKPAGLPCLTVLDGVRVLAPVDGDFGGTWIGTNEFGVSVGLLNGANLTGSVGRHAPASRSRGLLPLELLPLRSVSAIRERLRKTDLYRYAPFTVVALDLHQPATLIEWNGLSTTTRTQTEPRFMLTSSSFDAENVRRSREEEYARVKDLAFHTSHAAGPSAYSPCMHRPDAETVSFSWIRVSTVEAEIAYLPAAPCKRGETAPVHSRLKIVQPSCAIPALPNLAGDQPEASQETPTGVHRGSGDTRKPQASRPGR